MYLSENPHPIPIDFYKSVVVSSDAASVDSDLIIDSLTATAAAASDSSDHDNLPHRRSTPPPQTTTTKKRAETWVQEETRCLIGFRREVDGLFNTSKSNKHLWEQISAKMRDKGFDRSPTMCTDKWRNLLKEFKKARHQVKVGGNNGGGGGRSAKMSYYEDLQDLLRIRTTAAAATAPKLETSSFIRFSDKTLEEAGIPFGPIEGVERTAVDLERQLDHEGDPLAITAAEAVAASGVPPWNWREGPENGGEGHSSYRGRIITIKMGEYNTRSIGIDGTADAIKEVIKSAFGIRTKRAFWLEDEYQVVRS